MRQTCLLSLPRVVGLAWAGLFALALVGCGKPKTAADASVAPQSKDDKKVVIALLPKLINIDYFDACKRGATRAAEELGVTLI